MPPKAFSAIHELSLDQFGYFTADQARSIGVEGHALLMMQRRGTIERVAHGLYYNTLVPASHLGPYAAASLWPRGTRGVLSHATALEILGLSDADPARIHFAVPIRHRIRRATPSQYVVHYMDVVESDMTWVEGIPVTSAFRTIRDCHHAGLGDAILRQAVEDGRRTGRLSKQQANRLEQDLFTQEVKQTNVR